MRKIHGISMRRLVAALASHRGVRRTVAALGLAGSLAVGGALIASAQDAVSDERARQIALEHVPGTVLDLDRDHDEIEVEVRGEDGRIHEVKIDPRDGRVIGVEEDDADDDGDDD